MNWFFAELEKIAAVEPELFQVLDKLAMSMPGMTSTKIPTAPSMSSASVSGTSGTMPGALNIPGASWHCTKCGVEVKKKQVKKGLCPKCGSALKPAVDLKKGDGSHNAAPDVEAGNEDELEPRDSGEGSADGAAEKNAGLKTDALKQSAKDLFKRVQSYGAKTAKKPGVRKARRGATLVTGSAALAGGTYLGWKGGKWMTGQSQPAGYAQQYPKYAAARPGNPIMNIRKPEKGKKPSDVVKKLLRKRGKPIAVRCRR